MRGRSTAGIEWVADPERQVGIQGADACLSGSTSKPQVESRGAGWGGLIKPASHPVRVPNLSNLPVKKRMSEKRVDSSGKGKRTRSGAGSVKHTALEFRIVIATAERGP